MSDSPVAVILAAMAVSLPLAVWLLVPPAFPAPSTSPGSTPGAFPSTPTRSSTTGPHGKRHHKRSKKAKSIPAVSTPPTIRPSSPASSSCSSSSIDIITRSSCVFSPTRNSPSPTTPIRHLDFTDDASVLLESMDSESDWVSVVPTTRRHHHTRLRHPNLPKTNPWAKLARSNPANPTDFVSLVALDSDTLAGSLDSYSESSEQCDESDGDSHLNISSTMTASPPPSSRRRILSIVGFTSPPPPPPPPPPLPSQSSTVHIGFTKSQRKHLKHRERIKAENAAKTQLQARRHREYRLGQMRAHDEAIKNKRLGPPRVVRASAATAPCWTNQDGVPVSHNCDDPVAQQFLWGSGNANSNSEPDPVSTCDPPYTSPPATHSRDKDTNEWRTIRGRRTR